MVIGLISLLLIFLSLAGAGRYDRGVSVFSPEGEILQVRYAERAAARGLTLVCLAMGRAVVFCAAALPTDSLLDRRATHKLGRVDEATFMGFSGLSGDGTALLRLTRQFAVDFRTKFGVGASASAVAQFIGDLQHASTLKGSDRPYGVHVVLFGFEDSSPSVFLVTASGQVSRWKAIAIGRGAEEVNAHLEELLRRTDLTQSDLLRESIAKLSKLSSRSGEWAGMDVSWYSTDSATGEVSSGNAYQIRSPDEVPEELKLLLQM